ncbi:hypothetical protein BG011_006440 [Mortierella polycephala]|uniref:Beta-hexosaminidase n=1 Tax=Mortierella polycephala TaxID=41804 RepID=A0A9P6TZJ1_9FUNG|nr:hypothetical protein BG011_006440 [Mortierella polycephala]
MKLSIAAAIGLLALTLTEAVKVSPLPIPTHIKWAKSGPIKVDNNFRITGTHHEILNKAYARTAKLIKKERWVPQIWEHPAPDFPEYPTFEKRGDYEEASYRHHNKKATLKTVKVSVRNLNADLQLGVDESYTLDITASGQGSIKAKTIWGALNGLQTLNQIITGDGRKGLQVEQPVEIRDSPKFSHRGIMFDTARNFIPIKALKRQIDGMSYTKLNMTKDAFSPREIYTQRDIINLVQYGRERGVRVYPEIDMPGHSSSGWLQVDAKAVTCADSWWDNDGWTHHTAVQPNPGQLDIAYEPTYKLIKNVYREVAKLFKDDFFHVGFDELHRFCYNYSTPSMDWFRANPQATYGDFAQLYLDKALPIFRDRRDRRLVMWEDVVTSADFAANKVPKDIVMQSWNKGLENIKTLTQQGYDVIVSSADFLYLDCGYGGWVSNDPRYNVMEPPVLPKAIQDAFDANPSDYQPTSFNFLGFGGSWCAPYKTWQRIYGYDFTKGLTKKEAKHVIGAESPLWAEQVDEHVLDYKVWPRAAALAENLWSGNRNAKGFKRITELTTRIYDFRERLLVREITAAPLTSKYCLKNPHNCDLHRNQTAWGK